MEFLDNLSENPIINFIVLFLGTFISEDLTCIAAGSLLSNQQISLVVAFSACFLGILVSDIALFFIGYYSNSYFIKYSWFQNLLENKKIEKLNKKFDKYGYFYIFITRLVPGSRLPFYISLGLLKKDIFKFISFFILACLVWVPLILSLSFYFSSYLNQYFKTYSTIIVILLVFVLFFIIKRYKSDDVTITNQESDNSR